MVLVTVEIPTSGLVPALWSGRGGSLSRGGRPVQSTAPTRPSIENAGDVEGRAPIASPLLDTSPS